MLQKLPHIGLYLGSSLTWMIGLRTPKLEPTEVRTHDLWIMTEHFMPLTYFRLHSHYRTSIGAFTYPTGLEYEYALALR